MRGDIRTAALTVVALFAFASNSLLCRAALRPGLIDPASFTLLRLAAGAVALGLLCQASSSETREQRGAWLSALSLFAYAAAFSFAYMRLEASAGALILFGAVQVTMNGWTIAQGHVPSSLEWAGITVSIAGLLALTVPGMAAPDLLGAGLMLLAGVAWGAYSLLGHGARDPLLANARSFGVATAMAIGPSLAFIPAVHLSAKGVALALLSGAVTSGLGYSIWYAALRGLTATRAAIVQLAVPVLTGLGGALLLGERITPRLLTGGAFVLGGIALAVLRRSPESAPSQPTPRVS